MKFTKTKYLIIIPFYLDCDLSSKYYLCKFFGLKVVEENKQELYNHIEFLRICQYSNSKFLL